MSDIVNTIKDQYARFLDVQDWQAFIFIAEYYLRKSTQSKIKHVYRTLETTGMKIPPRKKILRLRNAEKRLFIGIGCELLVKAIYLKKGYCINKPLNGNNIASIPTHKIKNIDRTKFNQRNTFTFGSLIDHLKTVHTFKNHDKVIKGLKIAMTFRNKEGHVTFPRHKFNPQNYSDIEYTLTQIFDEVFEKTLSIQISMENNEIGIFKFTNVT